LQLLSHAPGEDHPAVTRRVAAVINAGAGGGDGEAMAEKAAAVFRAHGVEARMHVVRGDGKVADAARAAVSDRPDAVVAGGGDGTVNAVAAAAIESDLPIGILPLGTLNHFAKALHLPLDVEQAARVIIDAPVVEVDVGEVNGRIFLNNSSLGLYPSLVRRRDRQQEELGRGKWTAATWAALTLLRRHAFLHVRLDVGGRPLERRTAIVFIGNNAYEMSGLRVGERARLDSGQLGLYLPHRDSRTGLGLLALRALCGCLRETKDFDALFAATIDIESQHERLSVAIDGEVELMQAPLRYRTRPRALRIIAPNGAVARGAG
jgi:diacylglycerol kinase family enzyme